jgi:hypothetical protein
MVGDEARSRYFSKIAQFFSPRRRNDGKRELSPSSSPPSQGEGEANPTEMERLELGAAAPGAPAPGAAAPGNFFSSFLGFFSPKKSPKPPEPPKKRGGNRGTRKSIQRNNKKKKNNNKTIKLIHYKTRKARKQIKVLRKSRRRIN